MTNRAKELRRDPFWGSYRPRSVPLIGSGAGNAHRLPACVRGPVQRDACGGDIVP